MTDPNIARDELLATFREVPEFRLVSDEGLGRLVDASSIRVLQRGQTLARQGEVPDSFGIVLRGHVRAVHYTLEGRPLTVLVAWPGNACGIMAAQAGVPPEADFEAAETSAVACVPVAALHDLLDNEPAAARSLLDQCTRQLYETIRVVKSLTVDVGSRVARFLLRRLREAEECGSDTAVVMLAIPRVELAAQLGTVPETLSRAFAGLEAEGLISAEGRAITILDRDSLEHRAQGGLPEGPTV